VILAAGLLVLVGLALFVGGILTGMTALYWGCVAACVVAAVLLFLARRKLSATPARTSVGAPAESAVPSRTTTSAAPPERADTAVNGATGATAASVAEPGVRQPAAPADLADPPIEEVEVTDLLLVVDLKDEVLVIDERPRYHLAGCVHLAGRAGIPLPLDEARTDGFTPCAVCAPDRNLAQRARDRRKAAGSS
jgi:hypothetical protein